MSVSRRAQFAPPGGGRVQTTVFGPPLRTSSAQIINDASPAPAAFQLVPENHVPHRAIMLKHSGSPTRAASTMAGNNFWDRRDRGWRRGWPFRFYNITQPITGAGYRGVGNIHQAPAMTPPRMLLGLLPSQTSNWQPYQYNLDPSGQ